MPKKLLACMAIFVVVGCASQSPEPAPQPSEVDDALVAEEVLVVEATAEDYLQRARRADNRAQTYQYLLRATDAFLADEHAQKAAAVLSQLEEASLPNSLRADYLMQRAQLLMLLEQWHTAEALLNDIEHLSDRQQRVQLSKLYYKVFVGQERHLSAARQLVELALYDPDTSYQQLTWQHLAQVPAGYWRQGQQETNEIMRGWSSLFIRLTQALDQREPTAPGLERWLLQFPTHPANAQVQNLLANSPWVREQPRRIAVLLPLSGQFAQQGQAIRNGVLAALSNERDEDVLFIDTSRTDPESLIQTLLDENIEAVIGPLAPDYVERLAQTIHSREFVAPWVHLWLNRAPDDYAPQLDNFFALDIDTEVQSAVDYLSELDHQQVLVFGTDTQRGRQLATQFEATWQRRHGPHSSRTGSYRSSTEMPQVVEEHLHVRESKERISQVERAAGTMSIESEPRSRRDVSAIYLLGDAAQARLLKPFIETNISPFADRMPVYASSAIHEASGNRGRGDLDGITFSEAPWLLPEHDHADLLARFRRLVTSFPPSSQRLVAMGYDAMELLPRIGTMQWLPGYDHQGLTGQLRISDNAVQRSLNWAIFENNTVQGQPRNDHTFNRDSL